MIFVVKVGTVEQHTWATLIGWEVTLVQALGDYVDVVLKNSAVQNAHMFIHQFSEPFDALYAKSLALSHMCLNRSRYSSMLVYPTQRWPVGLQN
jgi:hypothetical protein